MNMPKNENNVLLCTQKGYCQKQSLVSLKKIHTPPFETTDYEFGKYMSFFLHLAPDISSSHSFSVSECEKEKLFEEMLHSRRFKTEEFCSSNSKIEKHLSKVGLQGNSLCLKCKRFVCKKKPSQNGVAESKLDCFLRHIRNSIAHGNVHYDHAGNKILVLFDDYNVKNLSARIVCLRADLEHWYNVLKNAKIKQAEK